MLVLNLISYTTTVAHIRDNEGVGMTHKITSPIKQPQFSQTTMRQYWLGKPKPKQPFSLTQNVFKKLENMATVYSFNIMVCTHLLITLGLIWYHYFYCRYKCQCVLPGCTLFLELLAVFGWDYCLAMEAVICYHYIYMFCRQQR